MSRVSAELNRVLGGKPPNPPAVAEGRKTPPRADGILLEKVSEPVVVPAEREIVVPGLARGMSEREREAWLWRVNPRNELERLVQLILRWRVDPVFYVIECLRVIPTPYQAQILLDLADAPREVYEFHGSDPSYQKRQILVPSGHGLGKTRVEAMAALWHRDTHKFSKTLITAPSAEQISGQLFGEMRKMHRRQKARNPGQLFAADWEILSMSVSHRDPEYGDWGIFGRTARSDKPESMQGAHALDKDDEFGQLAVLFREDVEDAPSGGMMVIAEEASGIPEIIRQVLEGALSEPGARFLACGNATRPDGWFADDLDKTDRYAVHELDCRMSDNTKTYSVRYRDFGGNVHELKVTGMVSPTYWENILEECDGDEDHDRVRVRIRGKKPRSAFEQVLRTHWIEGAQRRDPDRESVAEAVVISLDFGLTSDKHALAVRQGFNVRDINEWLPKDTPDEVTLDAAQRAIDAQGTYKAKYIIGDSNGVGRGAMEYLSRYYRERPKLNVTVIFFNAGRRAVDAKRFYRRRDEMWFKQGRAYFSDPRCSLPDVPGLTTQLTTPGFHEDATKHIRVESKDEIKKRTGQPSGNAADAVLMSLMVFILPEKVEEKKKEFFAAPFKRHFARLQAQKDAGDLIR